jgi:cysteine synthase A
VAVMPRFTSPEKIAAIEFQGGRCHLVDDPTTVYAESARLARELGGHYMDQFTYAERATDWRGNNNIAESIFLQMRLEPAPIPTWLVAAAGTGGTLATLGRYVRYCRHPTRVCGVDAERSVFMDYYRTRDRSLVAREASRIEGIGRPRVEASFMPDAIDAMVKIPDVWSLAAMAALSRTLGRDVGGSTGTNLVAALACAEHMKTSGTSGSIVTLLCDGGERYRGTYHDARWLAANQLGGASERDAITRWMTTGEAPSALREVLALLG